MFIMKNDYLVFMDVFKIRKKSSAISIMKSTAL
jgi:hypothetical protein